MPATAIAAKVNLDLPHTPRSAARLAPLVGARAERPLMVEPEHEPLFAALVAELGATWLGIAPAEQPGEGRVLEDDEPGPTVPFTTQEA